MTLLPTAYKTLITVLLFSGLYFISCTDPSGMPIDRQAMVNRHKVSISGTDPLNPLTLGNGDFAYTADITGLQSFPDFYEQGIPLGTQSNWGWHEFPNSDAYSLDDVIKYYRVGNDTIPYWYQYADTGTERRTEATAWLRENPHRMHLGLIGMQILKKDSGICYISDIGDPRQSLDLWKGELKSVFNIEGTPVEVITYCHQHTDAVAFRINSELLREGRIKVRIRFPYARHEKFSPAYDLSPGCSHSTEIYDRSENTIYFKRTLDTNTYFAGFKWQDGADIRQISQHEYLLLPQARSSSFAMSFSFSKDRIADQLPDFDSTQQNNLAAWKMFWLSGAAVDLSECTDPRASELERRIILSQYLTKIQCSGMLPPQETGLTFNSWHGKFHLEMHWWHALHFMLWNRKELITDQLQYYFTIFDRAKATALFQGYQGVRWPKMTGPEGRESPSTIGTFLIWQQPHCIYFAELLYQSSDNDSLVLRKYKELVYSTADFMASYARWDSLTGRYLLGPALIPAQERFDPETTINPAFELAYWNWGLRTAQKWRIRDGLESNKEWQHVIDHLPPIAVQDSLYLFTENAKDSYTNPHYLTDHPMVLGILGFLPPTAMVDRKIMEHTLDRIMTDWNWETIWGWDIPMAAMTATFLDRPLQAVDLLFMDSPGNVWLANGHNYQHGELPVYLPGNGGLLSAVALLCTYRNNEGQNGFPDNGKWDVKYENLVPWIE
jgi:hypothetical protein